MHSYGLKIHDPNDVEEGKAILEGLKNIDRQDWEAQQQQK